ncbi:MAG TPA: CDP-alcohol phosphatidyltransferase family protein [Candidatus Nanopelagicales bacterium]|nr:CDP-alcohol phosphatidyltransferase family protein [Candidatus Nanopelagicales bacterium]
MAAPAQDRTGRTYAEAWERIQSAQKRDTSVPIYLKTVNRPLGKRLACLGWAWGLTPNQVTGISALFSFSAIALVALVPTSVVLGVVVALLLLVGYAFDSADGQLARLGGGGSPAGEWLDHVTDAGRNLTLHCAVLIAWVRFTDLEGPVLLLPLGWIIISGTWFFSVMLRDQLFRSSGRARTPDAGSDSLVRSLILSPLDYSSLCLAFVLLGVTPAFVAVYGLLLLVLVLFLVRGLRKMYRELGRPGPES